MCTCCNNCLCHWFEVGKVKEPDWNVLRVYEGLLDSAVKKYFDWVDITRSLKLPLTHLKAGNQANNKTTLEQEEPDFHCERQRHRWPQTTNRAVSNRKLCGHHAGSRHASLVQDERVNLATTKRQTAAKRTSVPEKTRDIWTHPGCCSL